ncbi:MAG TPA: 30S ribosomal protein S14 [Myxococcota bacterium]|jgi:small subunit ribosomal protein S14|nr:30S ribosomal protein S14 [Myxococcota bacterium]
MPKLSQTLRDERRIQKVRKNAAKRAALRKVVKDPNASLEEKLAAQKGFVKLGRNSCPTRVKRRCRVTGRSRGYYRKFGLSRIMLRHLALRGELPGVRKASW